MNLEPTDADILAVKNALWNRPDLFSWRYDDREARHVMAGVLLERERCAKLADAMNVKVSDADPDYHYEHGKADAAGEIAAAIRRGPQS